MLKGKREAAAKKAGQAGGRPKVPTSKLKSVTIDFSVSEDEAQQLAAFAERQKDKLRPWARRMLLLIADGWRLVPPDGK
jgi:hypothetical protein